MSIITLDYFNSGIKNIPNLDAPEVSESVTESIEQYEEGYLIGVLGYPLYKVFMGELEMDVVPDRATNLLTGCEFEYNGALMRWCGFSNVTTYESPIADYVMANYVSDNSSATTGVGESLPKAVHSEIANCLPKVMQNWNRMVAKNKMLFIYLTANKETYPEYDGRIETGLFKPINYLGI